MEARWVELSVQQGNSTKEFRKMGLTRVEGLLTHSLRDLEFELKVMRNHRLFFVIK